MGADLRTFAVRGAKRDEVRDLVVSWMGAKGFEVFEEESLFSLDPESERGIVLTQSPGWIVVAFSHAFEEGDRLLFELKKLDRPLLEVWVHDSDLWGYRLYESSRLVASFNSKPRYFGGPPELELPENGDPALLCDVCELETEPRRIAAIQRRWALFSESIAERFCIEIGAEAAVLDYRDFDESQLEPGVHEIDDGTKIERLFFVRRGMQTRKAARRLHEIDLRVPAIPRVDPAAAALQAELQARLLPLTVLFRIVGWIGRALSWILGPLFLLWFRWRGGRHLRRSRLLRELDGLQEGPEVQQQGTRVVNRRHGCSIELPESAELLPAMGSFAMFSFRLHGCWVQCQALRPSQLRESLRLWPGAEVLEDEMYVCGGFPARRILMEYGRAEQTRLIAWHLVETPRAVYRFQASGEQLSEEVRQEVGTVVESFRLE